MLPFRCALLVALLVPRPDPLLAQGSGRAPLGAARDQGTLSERARSERVQADWQALVRRAERTSFPRRAGSLALRVVERREVPQADLASALLTLGASGMLGEQPRLEAHAVEGVSIERKGAILGLGELEASGVDPVPTGERLLERLLDDPDPEVAACALLALLQSGRPEWRTRARQLAASSGERLSGVATELLAFVTNPAESRPTPAAELLLGLRWDAARRYGLVDGRAWEEVLTEELRRDERFLDELVLMPASRLNLPAVEDHMLGLLVGGDGPVRLRAVVHAMATDLERILAAGLWEPATEEEWLALVEETLEGSLDRFLPTLFQLALAQPGTAPLAAGVLGREDEVYVEVLDEALASPDPVQRRRGCLGHVLLGDVTRLEGLRRLVDDPEPTVRAASLAARVRLQDPDARALAGILIDSEAPRERQVEEDRAALVEALIEIYRFPHVTEFLQAHMGSFAAEEIGGPLACLFLRGRETDTRLLHEAFDFLDPGSLAAYRVAQALQRAPSRTDVDFVAARFPVEGQPRLNALLGRTLLDAGHPEVLPLIEAAVWDKDWDRSLLAAAVALDVGGLRLLLGWIDSPPARADSQDIRRLGFAIGQWKGGEGLALLREHLRISTGEASHPELQGALLGYLVSRTH